MAKSQEHGFEFRVPTLPKDVYRKMKEIKDYEGITFRTLVIAGHLAFMTSELRADILAEAKRLA